MDRKKSPCSFDPTTNWDAKTKTVAKGQGTPRSNVGGSREKTDTFFGPGSPGWHSGKDGEINTTASDAGNTVATTGRAVQPQDTRENFKGRTGKHSGSTTETPRSFHSAQLVSPLEAVTRASLQYPKPKKPCRCGGMTGSRIFLSKSQAIAFE